jgi:hypothetical protein
MLKYKITELKLIHSFRHTCTGDPVVGDNCPRETKNSRAILTRLTVGANIMNTNCCIIQVSIKLRYTDVGSILNFCYLKRFLKNTAESLRDEWIKRLSHFHANRLTETQTNEESPRMYTFLSLGWHKQIKNPHWHHRNGNPFKYKSPTTKPVWVANLVKCWYTNWK